MISAVGLSLILFGSALERQQWAGRFAAMARAIPPLEKGMSLARGQAYRQFYGLDGMNSKWRLGTVAVAGQQIAVQVFLPRSAPTGTVVVVHGYLDHMGSYGHLTRRLLREGYRVVLYDMPGHGLSTGARADLRAMADYGTVFRAVRQAIDTLPRVPGPIHYVGHSTGASILLNEIDQGRPLEGHVVLIAPLVRWAHYRKSTVARALVSLVVKSVPRRFRRCSSDPEFMHFLREKDPLQQRRIPFGWLSALAKWQGSFSSGKPRRDRLVVIQGTADGTVHWSYNLKVLARRFPKAEFIQIDGADHHLVNERHDYRSATLEAVASSLAVGTRSLDRLDSGAQSGN